MLRRFFAIARINKTFSPPDIDLPIEKGKDKDKGK